MAGYRMIGWWPAYWILIPVVLQACNGRVPVTQENFARAETDWHFAQFVERGAFGHFYHFRNLGIVDQPGIRPNMDAYHSVAVFDLDAGPVAISLPSPGERFLTMQIIDEEHHAAACVYAPGEYVYDRAKVGSRYMLAIVQFFVDANDDIDSAIVHDLQDAIEVKQAATGRFDVPDWDYASQQQVKEKLKTMSASLGSLRSGRKKLVSEQEQRLLAVASDWGLPSDTDAVYLHGKVAVNDGSGVYQWRLYKIPARGFWSISIYDSLGRIREEDGLHSTINNTTAYVGPDSVVTIQLGACDSSVANCLDIFPGWQYSVRLYRPEPGLLQGRRAFPEPVQIR